MAVLSLCVLYCFAALALKFTGFSLPPVVEALAFGLAIAASAYLLLVASEVAEQDIPHNLSLAILVLLAVLPEYAVDLYFVWYAPHVPEYVHYAAANVTGANRLLVGLGWSSLVFVHWLVRKEKRVTVGKTYLPEVGILLVASFLGFVPVLTRSISPLFAVPLILLFILYLFLAARSPERGGKPTGVSARIAGLRRARRIAAVVFLFALAGATIFLSVEPFTEGLLRAGEAFGVDEFILIQWIAPLASETPEVVVAIIFALKLKPHVGFGALVSSKVNQWTLLVGSMPLVYSLSAGRWASLPLNGRQTEEIFLTAAQSLYAVSLLSDLNITLLEVSTLFALFVGQLLLPGTSARILFAWAYLALALVMFLRPSSLRTVASLYRERR